MREICPRPWSRGDVSSLTGGILVAGSLLVAEHGW